MHNLQLGRVEPTIFRAKWLWCRTGRRFENGALVTAGGRIVSAGPWAEIRRTYCGKQIDLGSGIIVPALVNLHSHLEYTLLASSRPAAPSGFVNWLRWIVEAKQGNKAGAGEAGWRLGFEQAAANGIFVTFDHVSDPSLFSRLLGHPYVVPLFEIIAPVADEKAERVWMEILELVRRCQSPGFGIAPHAPYTVAPDLLKRIARLCSSRGLAMSIHVAESEEEVELLQTGRGLLAEFLEERGFKLECAGRGVSPIRYLAQQSVLEAPAILVHANYVEATDLQCLRQAEVIVVHCPRSHEYFGHRRFPIELFLEQRIPVALGTDGACTLPTEGPQQIDLMAEMGLFWQKNPSLCPEQVLAMATEVPGLFLRRWNYRVGVLEEGMVAAFVYFGLDAYGADPLDVLLAHQYTSRLIFGVTARV